MPRPLGPVDLEAFAADFRAGLARKKLASKYDIGESSVTRLAVRLGLRPPLASRARRRDDAEEPSAVPATGLVRRWDLKPSDTPGVFA